LSVFKKLKKWSFVPSSWEKVKLLKTVESETNMRWSYLFSEQFAWSFQSVSIRAHHIMDIAAKGIAWLTRADIKTRALSFLQQYADWACGCFNLLEQKALLLSLFHPSLHECSPHPPMAERWPLAAQAPEWAHSLVFQSGVLRYLMFTSKQSRHTAARVQPFQSVFLQQLECGNKKALCPPHKRTSISGQINSFHPQRSQLGLLVLRAVEISLEFVIPQIADFEHTFFNQACEKSAGIFS
jgi:hypothetical protein